LPLSRDKVPISYAYCSSQQTAAHFDCILLPTYDTIRDKIATRSLSSARRDFLYERTLKYAPGDKHPHLNVISKQCCRSRSQQDQNPHIGKRCKAFRFQITMVVTTKTRIFLAVKLTAASISDLEDKTFLRNVGGKLLQDCSPSYARRQHPQTAFRLESWERNGDLRPNLTANGIRFAALFLGQQ
jgi:hypothetical protein